MCRRSNKLLMIAAVAMAALLPSCSSESDAPQSELETPTPIESTPATSAPVTEAVENWGDTNEESRNQLAETIDRIGELATEVAELPDEIPATIEPSPDPAVGEDQAGDDVHTHEDGTTHTH